MKDILTAPFVQEMMQTTANMYRLGWDERNGGNISYMLDEKEVGEYLDLTKVIRTIPTGFDAKPLIGKIFIVTGTGKYFKNIQFDPENNLGIIRIAEDGTTAELLWGYSDGGRFTSELPAHLMSHMARLSVDPENRIVMHCHPTNTLAMNYIHELDEKKITHTLWEMCTECIVVSRTGRRSAVDALRHEQYRRSDCGKDEGVSPRHLGNARNLRRGQDYGRDFRSY